MAEDGGKEVGGGRCRRGGGGVAEQMAAEGLTHALGGVRSGSRGAIFEADDFIGFFRRRRRLAG